MICIICNEPADKVSIYIPGEKTQLAIGKDAQMLPFGICSSHLDEEGNFLPGIEDQIKKNILNRIREGNVIKIDNLDDLNNFFGNP